MTMLEFVVFLIFMAIFKIIPTILVIYAPIFLLIEFLLILGLALGLSALNVFFRDVQFIWRLILQVGFFATPILYPITIFPENLQKLVMLNPMAGIISMMRGCLLYGIMPPTTYLIYITISMLIILFIGYVIFDHYEPKFAESI